MNPLLEEEDPMDQLLTLADLPTQEAAPEQDMYAPGMPAVQAQQARPQREAYPSDRSAGGSKSATGNVDPGLAFMAAFSQNPVLQRMVEESRNRPRVEAEERRKQEKWDLERDVLGSAKADKMRADTELTKAKVMAASQGMDPKSPYVRTLKEGIAAGLESQAVSIERTHPQYAELLRAKAKGIMRNEALTADQLKALSKDGMIGNLVKPIIQQSHNQALEAISQGQLGLGWSRAGEQSRHNRAMEDLSDSKLDMRIEKDQQKLNEKVAGLNEQEELLREAQEQKKKVNTGWLSNKLQQGLKYVGLADKDFMNLESTIAGVNNQIIKLQAGGNVTAGEATRMRQQLSDLSMDDEEFDIKLGRVIHQIQVKKQQAAGEYQRKPSGAVKDAAPISKRLVGEVEGAPAGKMKAPPGKAPGSMVRQKSTGKVFRVTPDGMLEEVQ